MNSILSSTEKRFSKRYWFVFAVCTGAALLAEAVYHYLLLWVLEAFGSSFSLQLAGYPWIFFQAVSAAALFVLAIRWDIPSFGTAVLARLLAVQGLEVLLGDFRGLEEGVVRYLLNSLLLPLASAALLFGLARGFQAVLKGREWGTVLLLGALQPIVTIAVSCWDRLYYLTSGRLPRFFDLSFWMNILFKEGVRYGVICGAYALLRFCLRKGAAQKSAEAFSRIRHYIQERLD